jgi:flavin-dependent dehydrogenase
MFTLQTENIILVADARVTGLLWKQNSVIGIQFEQGQNKENHTLEAELTVIASGRTTPISEWLRQANLSIPQATSLNSYLGYASRRYKVPNDVRLDSKVIAIQPRPKKQFYRGAGATQVENNEVIITLVGVNADYPPTEETKYLDFARSLTDPKTSEWIESLTPIGPIVGYRPISTLQHFDQIPNFPDGLLIMGDALCSFNPFYGQGMSVAATSSIMLDKILSQTNTKNLKGFTQRFQKSLAQSLFFPWYVGAAEDLRYPQTEGINPDVLYKLAQYGTDFLLSASGRDVIIGKKFLRVMHMLDNPIQLLTPIYGLHCLRYTTTSLFKSLRNIISAAPTST